MKKKTALALALALIPAMFGSLPLKAEMVLSIAYGESHQEIDGFGASDAWSIDPTIKKWMQEDRQSQIDLLADRLFSVETGIGLSAWRFNIGGGSSEQGDDSRISDVMRRAELLIAAPGEAVDKSKQRGQIRMLEEAYERGVRQFVAFANSPPHWATKNGLTHPGHPEDSESIGSTNLDPERLEDFARFLVDVVIYLRSDAVGVPINYLSPINEPTWDWQGQSQEANRYNMKEVAAVYRSVAGLLEKAGLDSEVEIDGAEVVEYAAALSDKFKIELDGMVFDGGMNGKGHGSYKNYIDKLLGEPAMRRVLHNKISVHAYWSDTSVDRLGKLRDLLSKNLTSVSPDAKLWMSEFCILGEGSDLRPFAGHGFDVADMDYALHVATVMHRDLTRLDASAWFWWLALTPYDYKDGLLKVAGSLDAESLEESKLMWTLGNFSRFVRPGYRRVDLSGADDLNGVMASAFKAPDDSRLIVVAINAGSKKEAITLKIADLPDGREIRSSDLFVTDAEHDLERVGNLQANGVFISPPRSTTTLVAYLGDRSGEASPETDTKEEAATKKVGE